MQQKDGSWVAMSLDEYWEWGGEWGIVLGPLPQHRGLDDKSAAVDTNFDAQTFLQRDKVTLLIAKSHLTLEHGRKIYQNTPSTAQTDWSPLSTAHLDFDGSKIISSGE